MPVRFAKPIAAVGLLLAMWGLDSVRAGRPRAWAGAPETAGPVRILEFYASVGAILPGQRAMLCYGVENAKSVRISPLLRGVYPSPNRCLEIVPEHTTHYTLLAEGYDGTVDARSLTLPVQAAPPARAQILNFALLMSIWPKVIL
jgi:hypothetical protein